MNNEILEYFLNTQSLKGTLDIFEQDFLNSYKKFKKPNKKIILNEIFHFFRHWYYSSLIEEEIYSPANFINSQIKDKFGDSYILLPKITPLIKGKTVSGFNYDYTLFTLDNHPVVNDLHKFINYCSPAIALTEDGLIFAKDALNIMDNLTFRDFYYVNFLNAIAQKLKLLKKMPSINTNKACPSNIINDFFKLSKRKQLEKIVDANIDVVIQSFYNLIPMNPNIVTKTKVESFLKTSWNLNDIIYDIYSPLGINIHEIIKENMKLGKDLINTDEKTTFLLSSYFITVIMINMSFICTFGHYLQLIQPITRYAFVFDLELEEMYNSLIGLTPIETALFKPITDYSLTTLGEELLLNGKKLSKNPLLIKTDDMSFNHIYKELLKAKNDFSLNFDEFLTKMFDDSLSSLITGSKPKKSKYL